MLRILQKVRGHFVMSFQKRNKQLMLENNKADIISTVEFDHTGNYLATGDKGGRVVLFERNESVGVACHM